MTGLTRQRAAEAVAALFGTSARQTHESTTYDPWEVIDQDGKKWRFVYDGSIKATMRDGRRQIPATSGIYKVEMNSPKLSYEEMNCMRATNTPATVSELERVIEVMKPYISECNLLDVVHSEKFGYTASIARRWIRQAVEQAMPEKGIIPIARVFIQFWGCLEFERTTATIWYHIV